MEISLETWVKEKYLVIINHINIKWKSTSGCILYLEYLRMDDSERSLSIKSRKQTNNLWIGKTQKEK